MHGFKIAIGGKGGVGKTTICAILAQMFARDGFDVLAIDADPNTNLAMAFGIEADKSPEPLIKMKELIAERTSSGKDAVGSYFRLNPKVSDLPEKYWIETNHVKLFVLGAITHAGTGCACPEGAFLKAMLGHTILQRKELVIVDLAAGPEFMGRASVQGIDMLVLIVEPGGRSIETANKMGEMAKELGIKHVGVIANKVTEPEQRNLIQSQLKDVVLFGCIDYSRLLQQADMNRTAVFEADTQVMKELKQAKKHMEELLGDKR